MGLLLRAAASGVALGILYDLLRIVRIVLGTETRDRLWRKERKGSALARALDIILVFLLDLLFGVCVGVVSVLLIYHANRGIFRGMVYGGMLCGFILYHFSLGKLVIKVSVIVTDILKKAVRKIICIIFIPTRALFRSLKYIYHLTIGKFVGKIITEVKHARTVRHERRIKKQAELSQAAPPDVSAQEDRSRGDFVYVDEKKAYKKEGRISFCKKDRSRFER